MNAPAILAPRRFIRVELTPEEFECAKQVGIEKHAAAVASKVRDWRQGPQDGVDMHIVGAVGEKAWAKYWETKFDDSPRGLGCIDAWTAQGFSIDIKTTRYAYAWLKAPRHKADGRADGVTLYVVGVLSGRVVTFTGWATTWKLFEAKRLGDHFGHGPCYGLRPGEYCNDWNLFDVAFVRDDYQPWK